MSRNTHLHSPARRRSIPGRCILALGLAACFPISSRLAAADGKEIDPNIGTGLYPASNLKAYGDDELRLDQIFQSHLPTTLAAYSLRLSVHPHLGDWDNKDRMRVTTSLRYGLTKNTEVSLSSHLFFSHGHGDVPSFDDYGAANLEAGFKFNLGQPLFATWDTAIGAEYEFPINDPVPELTDGLRHFRPYVTFSHRIAAHPNRRIFVGFRLNDVTKTDLPGSFGKNAFHQSSMGFTGGWVIDRDNLHYTFEASYDTTRLISGTEEDVYTIRPGVIWEIPRLHQREVISNWMIGVALSDTYGPGGNSVGASLRVRYTSDLKSRLHRTPAAQNAPRDLPGPFTGSP